MNKVARLAGIQLFAFDRRNESPPPLAHSWLGRLIVGSSRSFVRRFPWFSAKVISVTSWNPDWKNCLAPLDSTLRQCTIIAPHVGVALLQIFRLPHLSKSHITRSISIHSTIVVN